MAPVYTQVDEDKKDDAPIEESPYKMRSRQLLALEELVQSREREGAAAAERALEREKELARKSEALRAARQNPAATNTPAPDVEPTDLKLRPQWPQAESPRGRGGVQVAQSPSAPSMNLPPRPQVVTQGYPEMEILSMGEWGAKHFPKLARMPMVSVGAAETMNRAYDNYVQVQIAKHHAKTRQIDRNTELADRDAAQAAAAKAATVPPAMRPSDIPNDPAGQLGFAIMTNQPQAIQERLAELVKMRYGDGAAARARAGKVVVDPETGNVVTEKGAEIPNKLRMQALSDLAEGKYDSDPVRMYLRMTGVSPEKGEPDSLEQRLGTAAVAEILSTGRPGKNMQAYKALKAPSSVSGGVVPDRTVSESMLGDPSIGIPGLIDGIRADPVRGWLTAAAKVQDMRSLGLSYEQDEAVKRALIQSRPSVEQVRAAAQAGEITPEEAAILATVLGVPAETLTPPPQPGFFQRLFGATGAQVPLRR